MQPDTDTSEALARVEYLSLLEYPSMAVDEAAAAAAAAEARNDVDNQSEGAINDFLSDSTYEIISHSSSVDSDDEDSTRNPGADSLHSLRAATPDVDDENEQEQRETVFVKTPTDTDTDEQEESDALYSSSTLLSSVGDSVLTSRTIRQSTDHIAFDEPPSVWRFGFTDVVHTVSGNVARPGFPPRFLTIAQGMTAKPFEFLRPFEIWYFGRSEFKEAIIDKIIKALSLSATFGEEEAGSLDKPEGCPKILAHHAMTSPPRDKPHPRTVFYVRGSRFNVVVEDHSIKSLEVHDTQGSLPLLSDRSHRPDLAVFTHTQGDKDDATFKWSNNVGSRKVPTLDIDVSSGDWTEIPKFTPFGLKAVHMCIESRDESNSGRRKVLVRLPIDLDSFLELDPNQMNRNIACITQVYAQGRVDIDVYLTEYLPKLAKETWKATRTKASDYADRMVESARSLWGRDGDGRSKNRRILLVVFFIILLNMLASIVVFAFLANKSSSSAGQGIFGKTVTEVNVCYEDFPVEEPFLPTIDGRRVDSKDLIKVETGLTTTHPETSLSNPSAKFSLRKPRVTTHVDLLAHGKGRLQGTLFLKAYKQPDNIPATLEEISAYCGEEEMRAAWTNIGAGAFHVDLDPPYCPSPVSVTFKFPLNVEVKQAFELPSGPPRSSLHALLDAARGRGLSFDSRSWQIILDEMAKDFRDKLDKLVALADVYKPQAEGQAEGQSQSEPGHSTERASTLGDQFRKASDSVTAKFQERYPRRAALLRDTFEQTRLEISRAAASELIVVQAAIDRFLQKVQSKGSKAYKAIHAADYTVRSPYWRKKLSSLSVSNMENLSFQKARARARILGTKASDRINKFWRRRQNQKLARKAVYLLRKEEDYIGARELLEKAREWVAEVRGESLSRRIERKAERAVREAKRVTLKERANAWQAEHKAKKKSCNWSWKSRKNKAAREYNAPKMPRGRSPFQQRKMEL